MPNYIYIIYGLDDRKTKGKEFVSKTVNLHKKPELWGVECPYEIKSPEAVKIKRKKKDVM